MSTSLEEYSTFQYMLARPSTASAVTSKCTAFVFYDGPTDEDDKLECSRSIICRGTINTFNYYICCLLVLPSHILGVSKWISAEDKSSKARKSGDELRRFRYSYYNGFLNVDTRHVCEDDRDGNSSGGDNEQFRLVEYFDCSISVRMFAHAMFAFASVMVAWGIQKGGLMILSDDTSLLSAVGIVYVSFQVILACSGVQWS